jgi:hypothetical protein
MKRLEAGRHPRTNKDLVSVRRLRLAAGVSAKASTTIAPSSSQLKVPVGNAPAQSDESDPEVEAARELGLGTAFDDSD